MLDHDLVLKSDDCFFIGASPCDAIRSRAAGLYARDTRFLNDIVVTLNGKPLDWLTTTVHHATGATITSANQGVMLDGDVHLLPHQVAIEQRIALDAALHVTYRLHNYSLCPVTLELGLLFTADFHDLFAVRGFPRASRGTLLRPHAHEEGIHLRYRALDGQIDATMISFDRRPHVQLRRHEIPAGEALVPLLPGKDDLRLEAAPEDMAGVLATFPVELEPGGHWDLAIAAHPSPATFRWTGAPAAVIGEMATDGARIETNDPFFNRLLGQSHDDLAALMTSFPDGALPAAGIPWYVAPFGRDSLIASLQTLHLSPRTAEGTLRVLAALQGKTVDPFTEEEPGKILHEMRYGEMARLGEIPHQPYYGTVDATPLFVLLFAETIAWTADEALYSDLLPQVLAALDWIEAYGDIDGDGMIDYRTESDGHIRIRHQVWKDSHDSLHYADGRVPEGTITPVEVQGYTYAALRRLADVTEAYGDAEAAANLRQRAARLRERFERAFWLEERGFYAQALDDDKTPVDAISSNPGHLLFTGIVSPEQAVAIVRRLRQPDMESGWGIRSLSSASRSYNPMSYHNGSVWPHDNSIIAAGCYAIGEAGLANEIFTTLFDAGRLSADGRLNELYCGFARTAPNDAPVPYPAACSPQAWAAGCYPHLVRSALGLTADVGRRTLTVNPQLPPFLDTVTIRNMSVFGRIGCLRVRRSGDGYDVESEGLPLEVLAPAGGG
jgi:glycogen debranching enzyme